MNAHALILGAEISAGIGAVILVCPPPRRVAVALAKFAKAHAPKWLALILAPLFALAAITPGQADDLVIIAVALAPGLRTRENRAELWAAVKAAWRN